MRQAHTLITADGGYHSDFNTQHLKDHNIPALIADNQMRSRDERVESQAKYKDKPDPLSEKTATGKPKEVKRFQPKDFIFNNNTATCPAGNLMTSPGCIYTTARGLHYQTYTAKAVDCNACKLSAQCLKGPLKPNNAQGRQVTRFEPKVKDPSNPSELMRQAIDSPRGRQLYRQHIGTVEPVFANIRHNKRMTRLNHRGHVKVNTSGTCTAWCTTLRSWPKRSEGEARADRVATRLADPHQNQMGSKLRQTVGMNTQILILKRRYAQGMANACEIQVFLQPR